MIRLKVAHQNRLMVGNAIPQFPKRLQQGVALFALKRRVMGKGFPQMPAPKLGFRIVLAQQADPETKGQFSDDAPGASGLPFEAREAFAFSKVCF